MCSGSNWQSSSSKNWVYSENEAYPSFAARSRARDHKSVGIDIDIFFAAMRLCLSTHQNISPDQLL